MSVTDDGPSCPGCIYRRVGIGDSCSLLALGRDQSFPDDPYRIDANVVILRAIST